VEAVGSESSTRGLPEPSLTKKITIGANGQERHHQD